MSAPGVNGRADLAPQRSAELLAEQTVIGALLTASPTGAYADVPGKIRSILSGPGDFLDPRHALIYQVVQRLADDARPHGLLDVLSTMDADVDRRSGGAAYLQTCAENMLSVPAAVEAAHRLREAGALRELAKLGAAATAAARTTALSDAPEAIARIQQMAAGVRVGAPTTAMATLDAVNIDVINEMEAIAAGTRQPGISTGWEELDRLLGGVRPGAQAIVAGRPGIGKSVAARYWAWHLAVIMHQPALVFSLEMSKVEVVMAMISAASGVPLNLLRSGRLTDTDWGKVARAMADAEGAPLFIDDTTGIGPSYVARELERVEREVGKPAAFFVDYLQLVRPETRSHSREQEVAGMSRTFKEMGMQHGCVSVVLSQLNRGPESRNDKRPQLSDLRESGSIEQDADIVLFVHRDDYYDKESPRAGEADLIVAKHRQGATDTVTVASQLHLSRFKSMEII